MAGLLDRLAAGLATMPGILALAPNHPCSLDQLRSDLSHETASRVAFLSAISAEWRRGRFQCEDPQRCAVMLAVLRAAHRQYALAAFTRGRCWHDLVAVLASIRAIERETRRAPGAAAVATIGDELARLKVASARLVEKLTTHHAIGLCEVVRSAAAEVKCEFAGQFGPTVAIEVDVREENPRIWLPRSQAARWRDVVRNLIRNAVEATRRQWSSTPGPCPPVKVSLVAHSTTGGIRLEIADLGAGMDDGEAASMWTAGASRHGSGRGQGLTEAKRTFVAARAEIAVVSEVGRGTTITLDFEPRDIDLPVLRPWRRPGWQVAALTLLAASAFALPDLMQTREASSARYANGTAVQGIGPHGEIVWNHELTGRVLGNDHLFEYRITAPAVHHTARDNRLREILVAIRDEGGGPGRLEFLDGRGKVVASREVAWTPPRGEGPEELGSFWQAPVAWRGGPERAYVVDVRKASKSPESIQVVTAAGDDLGAYLHPGQIKFFACEDFDGDGEPEFLLHGINNDVARGSPLVDCPQPAWHGCAILLAPPPWQGQAYPHRAWEDVPPARERAYLLIAPVDCSGEIACKVAVVERVSPVRLLLRLEDGRILETDGRLRPLHFGVGDRTAASRLEHSGHQLELRVAYFHDGTVEIIDVKRQGAS